METRVNTGKNRCERMRMGYYGCGVVQGAWGRTKILHIGTKIVSQALIWPYGRGSFPKHHVLQTKKQMRYGWFRIGAHRFIWGQWCVFARGDRKTRGNETKIGDHGHVLQVQSRQKNANWESSQCDRIKARRNERSTCKQ